MTYCPGMPKDTRFPDLDPRRVIAEAGGRLYLRVRRGDIPPRFAWHGDLLWAHVATAKGWRSIGPSWFRIPWWPTRVAAYRPADRSEV